MPAAWKLCALIVPLLSLGADDAWKSKRAADWTDAETKLVLTASPWAAMVTPTVKKTEQKQGGHGVGISGIPGLGRRRTQTQDPDEGNVPAADTTPLLTIRWESALPIREAELKARETNAPDVDTDHYAIAVYGIPSHLAKDPQHLGDRLKDQAAIKREGQKDLKPSHVDVLQRDDGVVIVFLFPRSKEITAKDARAEFNTLIGQYQIEQPFHIDEMIYQGKVEL
jgi:hypothetical protein